MTRARALTGLTLLAGLAWPRSAAAEEPATLELIQLGGGLGYGIFLGEDDNEPPNPYGLGLKLAGGYTLPQRVYVGGEFNYFFGGSRRQQTIGGDIDLDWNILQLGAEVGYDVPIARELILRPKLGLGFARVATELSTFTGTTEGSEAGLSVPLGLQVVYALDKVLISGELRYHYFSVTADEGDGFAGTANQEADLGGLWLGVSAYLPL